MNRRSVPGTAMATALCLLALGCGAGDEKEIRRSFSEYRQALLDKNGGAAAGLVAAPTVAYYDKMRVLALTAPEQDVRALPIMDRLMVLRLRHSFTAAMLRSLTGTSLLVLAVNEGLVDKASVEKAELGRIEVQGDEARAEVMAAGRPTPLSYRFLRENDRWRFDLLPLMAVGSEALRTQVARAGVDENILLFMVLERLSGRAPDPSLWQPPAE